MQRASANFRPTRYRGQCFLQDPRIIERIVSALSVAEGETLLEIGAGAGQLTLPVLISGARVIAVETDARLAAKLARVDRPELDLVQADALALDFRQMLRERGLETVRVYGNLPYSVAAPILLRLLSYEDCFRSMILMFQKEVAERLVAEPSTKDYSFLSVVAQQAAEIRVLFTVPPQAFRPRPRVMSALVRLDLRHAAAFDYGDEKTFRAVAKSLLAHRRKTIANNIKHLAPSMLSRPGLLNALEELGVDPGRRAETLSVQEFAAISRICASAP